ILSSLHSPSQTSLCFVSHICSLEISGERSNGEGKSERTSEESKEPQIRKIRWRGHTEGRRDRSIDGKLIVNPDGLSLDARKIDFLEEINDISTTFPAHMRSDSRNQRNSERVNACVVWSRKDHESQICWRLLGKPPRPLVTWIAIRDSLVGVIAVVKAAWLLLDDGFCL
ncbi:unnamed protein product, partial [Linum tenue]